MSDTQTTFEVQSDAETKRFVQERKNATNRVSQTIRNVLVEFYDCSDNCIVSVENSKNGEYNTNGRYDVVDFLDYSGVDWLVDSGNAIIPVGERIRPNKTEFRDFSWRVDNGTTKPCENDRVPAGIDVNGLFPIHIFFGWVSNDSIDRLWCIDTKEFINAVQNDVLNSEIYTSPGGAKARYYPIGELGFADCIIESWEFSKNSGE